MAVRDGDGARVVPGIRSGVAGELGVHDPPVGAVSEEQGTAGAADVAEQPDVVDLGPGALHTRDQDPGASSLGNIVCNG